MGMNRREGRHIGMGRRLRRTPTAPKTITVESKAEFLARTLPHLQAIYSDALCLTGCSETAADLVIITYVRAYFEPLPSPRTQTQPWLLGHLHAVFCEHCLWFQPHPH